MSTAESLVDATGFLRIGDHLMSTNDSNRDDNREQEDRINELKQQAEQAAGCEMSAWDRHLPQWGDEPPPEVEPERTT